MPTVLILDNEKPRVRAVGRKIRAELPDVQVCTTHGSAAFRYALVATRPAVVVLPYDGPNHESTELVWEAAAIRPQTKVLIVAHPTAIASAWQHLGDAASAIIAPSELSNELRKVLGLEIQTAASAQAQLRPLASGSVALDGHRMKNRLAGLLAGMHAMAAELRASAPETERIPAITDEYVDRLVDVVGDICAMVAAAETEPCQDRRS